MSNLKLTKEQEQLLREQTIDQNQPGSILRDVTTILDFIGPTGVKSAGKYNLLPMDALPELDNRLSHPLHLPLKRPQLRSHPYLQGLHLVLRATGLLQVSGTGEKMQLVVPAEIRERWQQLNPTEQYFALLEGWLLVGRSEMVGEYEDRFGGCLLNCLMAWRGLPAEGLKSDPNRRESLRLPHLYGAQYQLALMDLFGLVQVEHATKPVVPWAPGSVKHVPFGDALFTLMLSKMVDDRYLPGEGEGETRGFGQLQPIFRPYFPQWQASWVISTAEAREGIFVFRVSLSKSVWRTIAIDARDTLDNLMDCILAAIDFDNDHLYEFSFRDRFGVAVRAVGPISEGELATAEVQIGDLPLDPGQSMNVVYDFGDNWKFTVKLERVDPPSKRRTKPKILESRGKAPEQYPEWE
jgi:hypothetical protein